MEEERIKMATDEKSLYKIDRLNYDNYSSWAFKIRLILQKEKVLDVITKHPPVPVTEQWTADDAHAFRIIALAVDNSQVVHIKNVKESGSAAWKVLKEYHQRNSAGSRMRIMKKLFTCKLLQGTDMKQHIGAMLGYFDQLSEMGGSLKEEVQVAAILASLPSDYDSLITSLEAWEDDKLTLSAVKNKLLEEFEKKSGSKEDTGNSDVGMAFKRRSGFPFKCHQCQQVGHKRAECPNGNTTNVSNDLRNKLNKVESAKMARFNEMYMLSSHSKKDWIIDSGASAHMCADRNHFKEFDANHKGGMTLANGEEVEVTGKGKVDIKVKTMNGPFNITLNDVLYLPNADENLISVKKIVEKGITVVFNNKECYVKADKEKLILGKLRGNLWKLDEPESCYRATHSEEKCIHEWHKRLAHRNLKDIRAMECTGLKIKKCDHSNDCEACIKGKMNRRPFPNEATPVKAAMDCIVSDVCGPMQVESLGRKRYFVSFIDVFSGYTKLYFIRAKSEVPEIAIEYIEFLKTQTGKKPKTLRTDRGTEYLNNRLQSYLRKEGIKFECTVGYAPEQNGIAERKNRTLMEATRSMLAESSLPKAFWAEATSTANFVFNRLVDPKTKKSPHELLFKENPNTMEFQEFGADAYIMIPYEKRRKLDDKAVKVKFVGYSESSKGYRLADKNYRIHVSREVKFVNSKDQFTNNSHRDISCENFEIELEGQRREEDELIEIEVGNAIEAEDAIVAEDAVLAEELEAPEIEVEPEEEFHDAIGPEQEEHQIEAAQIEPVQMERRSTRQNLGKMPEKLRDYRMYCIKNEKTSEPLNYKEATNCEESEQWLTAMNTELAGIEKNETWELTELPEGRKAIGSKWVFKVKKDEHGKEIFKARLVAQGFTQRFGIDYDEVFAPVTRDTTFRLLLSVAGTRNYIVSQYDIKTAFLNGKLEEEIYLQQPPGFRRGDKVYRLKKSLYGLKQAANVWNKTLHESLIRNGCTQNETDKCLYKKEQNGMVCYIIIHVDDMLTATNNESFNLELMNNIGRDFELKCLGKVRHYLGINVENILGDYYISQTEHIDKIIKEANLSDGKDSKFPMDTGYFKLEGTELESNENYRKMIGMLLYLSTKTRPDIAASVAILSQKVAKPRDCDWNELKRVIRYLKSTRNLKLRLSEKDQENKVDVFSDASWAEDKTDRKSNTGYICKFNGGTISWSSKKQCLVTLSSMESEYVALTETCKEVLWLTAVSKEFSVEMTQPIVIKTDSQSCINAIRNQKFSYRTKHIDTRYHFIRDQVNEGKIQLEYCQTDNNTADMMTKPLGSKKIMIHREAAGVIDPGDVTVNTNHKIEGTC